MTIFCFLEHLKNWLKKTPDVLDFPCSQPQPTIKPLEDAIRNNHEELSDQQVQELLLEAWVDFLKNEEEEDSEETRRPDW